MKINFLLISLSCWLLVSCGGQKATDTSDENNVSGQVSIDGSSTVYPITEAVAEEFQKVQPDIKVSVALSGTGGGFKKFGRA